MSVVTVPQSRETVITRVINGYTYAILFCPEILDRNAYEVTRDGQVIDTRLHLWEAKEVLAAADKSPVPADFVEFPCAICQRPAAFRDESHDVACTSCRRAQAESAANSLRQELNSLRRGEPPFDVLTPRERAQELAQLNGAPDPIERQRIELQDEQDHRELTLKIEADATGADHGYPWA